MRLPMVKLRNTKTGKELLLNEIDWAEDLGRNRWRGWIRVGEQHTGRKEDIVHVNTESEFAKPKPVELPPVDREAAELAAAKKLETIATDASIAEATTDAAGSITDEAQKIVNEHLNATDFTDRGGNEQPVRRGRGRPRKIKE